MMTCLMVLGLATSRILTPTSEPSMMPTIDGTTIMGSTAP